MRHRCRVVWIELCLSKPWARYIITDMSTEVHEVDLPAQTLLAIQRSFAPADIAGVLAEILPKVYQFAVANEIDIAGAPVCRYKEWTKERATVEAGLPVTGTARPEGEIILSSIPAGRYASVIHKGSYDTVDQAHRKIEKWLQRRSLSADSDAFEVYLTDSDEQPDPAEWQTQVMRRLS